MTMDYQIPVGQPEDPLSVDHVPSHSAMADAIADIDQRIAANFQRIVDLESFALSSGGSQVWKVDPAVGSIAGGTDVTILGNGFTSVLNVTFGGVVATNVAVVDAQHVTCTTPANPAGAVDVTVVRQGQNLTGHGAFTYQ